MSELEIAAPAGAHFEFEEVKTAKGTKSLGQVPILVWHDHDGMVAHYGAEGVLAMADGTSFRVSFQNIARRFKSANKTDNDIAKAQIDFRPGKRAVGESTPASRAARNVKAAVEKGVDADALSELVAKVAAGQIDLAALLGRSGQ